MYAKELEALRRAGRLRERRLYDPALIDLASNDYLGLAGKSKQLHKALAYLQCFERHAPMASMLVNGYHEVHARFEEKLCKLNGFEAGIAVGSGFLANLSLIEALVRKHDRLFIDAKYHASGILASRLLPDDRVHMFRHNDAEDLRRLLRRHPAERAIIAVEGVYSMEGDLCKKEIFDVADEAGVLLIVDEAHSSGVLGERLTGIFEHYGIAPHAHHIKMGTLGKAYGSYGAYILASREIVDFLQNRAKPIIYSTAPSLVDVALATVNLRYILKHAPTLRRKLDARLAIAKHDFPDVVSPIIPVPATSNETALALQRALMQEGFLVGAIRQPTVERPILRIIARLGARKRDLRRVLQIVKSETVQ